MAPEHPDFIRDTQSIGIESANARTFDQVVWFTLYFPFTHLSNFDAK
jgi:hypothetical protein